MTSTDWDYVQSSRIFETLSSRMWANTRTLQLAKCPLLPAANQWPSCRSRDNTATTNVSRDTVSRCRCVNNWLSQKRDKIATCLIDPLSVRIAMFSVCLSVFLTDCLILMASNYKTRGHIIQISCTCFCTNWWYKFLSDTLNDYAVVTTTILLRYDECSTGVRLLVKGSDVTR